MLDRFIYGQVERISPEAPVPVLRVDHESSTLGGAGNVVRNVAALGGAVEIIGVVGQDASATGIMRACKELAKLTPHLIEDPSRPTTQKIRYIAGGQQLLRADCETSSPVSQEIENTILEHITQSIVQVDAVIFSDYAKGALTPKVLAEAIRLACAAGKIVIVDPKGRDFSRYADASVITPNRKELSEVSGVAIKTVADAEDASRRLIDQFNIGAVLSKLGGEGVCLIRKGEPAKHFQTKAREVFDVSGAGDTVIATLTLALCSGFEAEEAAEIANIAGSIVVGKIGTASVSRDEIERALMLNEATTAEDKIVGFSTIGEIAERWRRQGYKVGFANGCFDLLHPGHISLLRQARSACNKLIVGLNSDASIKRLKGQSRPIQNEASRSAVLASLSDVDQVVIFGEDTPLELIKIIRPDVLVKGADYTIDKVVGAAEVASWGGKVVLADLLNGHSTTSTISKISD